MYCKLFTSLYQGTLRGKSDELLVFTNMLAHADQHGIVDMHWQAIADETGLPRDRVEAAIKTLESPDSESRSPEMDGCRIVLLDEHRAWGWKVVNYLKYRAIRNEDDRKEQNRLAQEKFRNKSKQSKPPSSHTEAKADTEAEALKSKAIVASVAGRPDCPHQEIIDLYNKILPELPAVQFKNWTPKRRAALQARWREDDDRQNLEFWERYFAWIRNFPFYMGENDRKWRADLDWILKPAKFIQFLEKDIV